MKDDRWYYLTSVDKLEDNVPSKHEVEGKEFLVYKNRDKISVMKNSCSHYGGPLSEGIAFDNTITCPWHNASFEISTGKALRPALDDLPVYHAKNEDGKIYINFNPIIFAQKPKVLKDKIIAIIGAGAAGNSAAETLRKEGFDGKIFLSPKKKKFLTTDQTFQKIIWQAMQSPNGYRYVVKIFMKIIRLNYCLIMRCMKF